jgi:hypothetical protein
MASEYFPPRPAPSITQDDLVAYLADLQAQGSEVYTTRGGFVVVLNATDELYLSVTGSGVCQINHKSAKGLVSMGVAAQNVRQVDEYIRRFTKGNVLATSVRTKRGEPATNHARVARLVGASKVEAIYDPYLDDKGLGTFLSIVRLSGASAPGLRALTTDKGAKRLSARFADAVFQELGHPGEFRRTSIEAHRRFMLLSGGRSLILRMSLNSIDKDEVASVEDDRNDRPFFDSEWESAKPLEEK